MSDENIKTEAQSETGVRERLLEVAKQLFCEKGYDGASIREIAAAADCNVAAVNYYFGGKQSLYEQVWRDYLIRMRNTRLERIGGLMQRTGQKPTLEELLSTFADSFLNPWTEEEMTRRVMILMAREMVDPHLPGSVFVDNVINPTIAAMSEALSRTCPGIDRSRIPLVLFSISGQLIHAVRIKAMFEQSTDAQIPDLNMDEAVEHIVKFSAGGIRAYMGAEDGN